MNRELLDAHLEMHRLVMTEVKKRVAPSVTEFGRELTLSEIRVDEDGVLLAEYSRYEGCGSYQTKTVHLDPYTLFKDQK